MIDINPPSGGDGRHYPELTDLYRSIGQKWTIPLIHHLSETPLSFNDIKRLSKNNIAPSLLSTRLAQLTKLKIVKRTGYQERLCYTITEEGEKLKIILNDILDWSICADYKEPKIEAENKFKIKGFHK